MNNLNSNINIARGIEACPKYMGTGNIIYPHMYVETGEKWHDGLNRLCDNGQALKREFCPDPHGTDNCGPVGAVHILRHDGFLYAYTVNPYGDWELKAFTDEKTAGDMTGWCIRDVS